MRPFASSAALLAFAVSASAYDMSTPSDQDGSVWAALNGKQGFSVARRSNRPFKRQSGWNPPSELTTPLKEVWDHQVETYSQGLFGFKNYGWDQLIAAQGTVNMCVRWESSASVTEAQRAQVAEAAQRSYAKWFEWLYGFDNFPYTDIPVKVTGWAVRDTSLLQGSTDGIDVYTDTDAEGIPQCATSCGRFFNQNGDYSRCPGGAERRYDQTLWLTDGFGGGAGGDWGARVGREYFMNSVAQENIHIYLHEIGHTFGLDDFYDWTPSGVNSFIMLAGSASQITDFDGWMFRNWWYELSRDRDWQSAAAVPTPAPAPTAPAPAPEAPATTAAPAAPTSTPEVVPEPAPVPTQPVEEDTEEDIDETIDEDIEDCVEEDEEDDLEGDDEEDLEEDDEEDLETPCPVSPPSTPPVTPPVSDADTGVEAAGQWGQCGGLVWTGPKTCGAGLTCTEINPYYSQCL